MKLLFQSLIIFFLCFIISSCAKKKHDANMITTKSTKSESMQGASFNCEGICPAVAYVKVDGVECKFCADLVLNEISKINGIISAEYENTACMVEEDFDNNRIKLVYNNNVKLDKSQISEILTKEGFDLKSVESLEV